MTQVFRNFKGISCPDCCPDWQEIAWQDLQATIIQKLKEMKGRQTR